MEKPVIKKEVAIITPLESMYTISFFATTDAMPDFEEFGRITSFEETYGPNSYRLEVDRRYDFKEVLNYIENYG